MSPPHVITGLAFCLSFVACTPSPATDPARAPAAPPPAPSASAAVVSKDAALALHRAAIVIDTHNDVTQRLMIQDANLAQRLPDGQTDLPRMREGGLDAEFLSVFVVPQLYPKEQAYPQ